MKSSEGQKHVRNILEAPVSSTEHHTKEVLSNSLLGFPGGSGRKNLPANAGDAGSIPGSGRSPGGGPGNSRILAWRVPWTEKPGRLVHRVAKSQTRLKQLSACTHTHTQALVCVRYCGSGVSKPDFSPAGHLVEQTDGMHSPHRGL